MTMESPLAHPLPLFERKPLKNRVPRAIELTILILLFTLLGYRLLNSKNHGILWIVAFCCETWFTFTWILIMNCKWNQIHNIAYPDRLQQSELQLPAVDMFVTTADPVLEPPVLTVNTVLSLLAVDYPSEKLACYVSDDAASPLMYYSLVEAAEFAKIWVPFCKKHNITQRAPFRYFNNRYDDTVLSSDEYSLEFKAEWKIIKDEYEKLYKKLEEAAQKTVPCELVDDYADFVNIDRKDHPTIIKIIWEEKEGNSSGMPHLIYISREKRPNYPHHYKAGAMNVLTRVSGMMSNAPYMVNVDCDMYANNPKVVQHAMCFLLGASNETDSAFVQFPPHFYDGLKDDPFGNQMICLLKFVGPGIAGLQGPMYGGTGCFHRRKVIYGALPQDNKSTNGQRSHGDLQKHFGTSQKLNESVAKVLTSSYPSMDSSNSLSNVIDEACHVASCVYDKNTSWGKEVGWIYGSCTEDVLTGLTIHKRGWRSIWCAPDPPAFLGSAPSSGPTSLIQQKRWSTGLLEILFSSKSPIVETIFGKLRFRQCGVYLWILTWGMRSIFEICYASLPAFCMLTNSHFLPKENEPAIFIPITLFVIYNLYSLSEYLQSKQTIRAWWNNQRMARLVSITSWLLGFLTVTLKLLGISEVVFEVTKKDQGNKTEDNEEDEDNIGRFTFDDTPIYVPGVTILMINLSGLGMGLLGFFKGDIDEEKRWGVGEVICSIWIVLCLWAFLKGLFGKGKYGIPLTTIYKSSAVALLLVHLSRWISSQV